MTTARELLTEAGQHLVRAEALLERAAGQLEEPGRGAMQYAAAVVERIRKRVGHAAAGSGDG
jgi:hypothetical protein